MNDVDKSHIVTATLTMEHSMSESDIEGRERKIIFEERLLNVETICDSCYEIYVKGIKCLITVGTNLRGDISLSSGLYIVSN